jgi:hypothetical protein
MLPMQIDEQFHKIYILDHPNIKQNNMMFLQYIKNNQPIIKKMGVKLLLVLVTQDQLQDPNTEAFIKKNNILQFPALITSNKVYQGYKDIVSIYDININKYYELIKEPAKKQEEAEEDIHELMKSELSIKNTNDIEEEEQPFGSSSLSMMDNYRDMVEKRGPGKNVRNSNFRSVEINEGTEKKTNSVNKKNDNTKPKPVEKNNPYTSRTDNIKESNISIPHDDDVDPQDAIMERAYWSRISESN